MSTLEDTRIYYEQDLTLNAIKKKIRQRTIK